MSSKRGPSFFRTVTFRLALRHAGLFSVLSLATFLLVYLTLQANLTRRVDDELREDAREIESKLLAAPGSQRVATFREDFDAADAGREFRVLFDPQLGIRTTSDLAAWKGIELAPPHLGGLAPRQEALRTVQVPASENRARAIVRRMPDGGFIEFGSSLADNEELLGVVRRIFALGWTATIV